MKLKCLLLMAVAGFALTPASRAADVDTGKLLTQIDPAVVTIKFLLKMNMGAMGDGPVEKETEINGLVISEGGLIVCSNTQLSGPVALMKHFMRGQGGDQISSTPTEIKILIGDDQDGIDGEMIARDSELDLAWVKVKDAGDKKFTYVDPAKGAAAGIGTHLYAAKRLSKFFDRAPVIAEITVGGVTKKPRELYVPTPQVSSYGTPFFNAVGELAGIAILQLPGADEAGDDAGMGMFSMSDAEMFSAMLLPAHELAAATKRALDNPEKAAEEKAKPEEKKK